MIDRLQQHAAAICDRGRGSKWVGRIGQTIQQGNPPTQGGLTAQESAMTDKRPYARPVTVLNCSEIRQAIEDIDQQLDLFNDRARAMTGATTEAVNTTMAVQTKVIEFAERHFDRIRDNLVTTLDKYPKEGG